MSKQDILNMIEEQNRQKSKKGRYVQVLPGIVKPDYEDTEVTFVQIDTEYKIHVNVWTRLNDDQTEDAGFQVVAVKDLGDGVTETITSRNMEND